MYAFFHFLLKIRVGFSRGFHLLGDKGGTTVVDLLLTPGSWPLCVIGRCSLLS